MIISFIMVLTTFILFFAASTTLPAGKGKDVVQQHCVGCHALKVVTSKRATKEQWSSLVDQMVSRGAEVDDDDIESVVEYLAANFGPLKSGPANAKSLSRKPVNVNTATAGQLTTALGISAKESAAIVTYRKQNGSFKEWTELTKVPGVDPKQIENHKDRLTF
jgi:competence ComEA-like helix-hairpin-helix protein